jgi:membrane fusion protein (multidrug efflux system)
VNFSLSEIDYVKYPERFQHLENRDLTWFGKQAPLLDSKGATDSGDPGIEIVLADGSAYPHKGLIVSANRQIDATTGTIQLQALAANPDGLLRPGQYGRVRIRRRDAGDNVLVVPDKALVAVQGQYSVAVVGPDNKVQLRRVELGPSAKGLQIIEKGIAEGDRVVVEGVQKAADGATVDPKPAPDAARASSGAPPAGGVSAAKN